MTLADLNEITKAKFGPKAKFKMITQKNGTVRCYIYIGREKIAGWTSLYSLRGMSEICIQEYKQLQLHPDFVPAV